MDAFDFGKTVVQPLDPVDILLAIHYCPFHGIAYNLPVSKEGVSS
jgi:hypothetical protein